MTGNRMLPRLFDCFTFFNELDLLELRLRELDALVHRFVLVEAPQTFTRLPKPLHFKLNRDRFQPFLPKIIYVELEEFPADLASAWDREYFSRRAIMRGLDSAAPDDLVLISDVDEIPKPANLKTALRSPSSVRRLTVFESKAYLHYLNARSRLPGIVQSPRLLARRYLRDPQAVRSLRPRISKNRVWGPALEFARPLVALLRSWSELGHPLPVKIEYGAAWHFASLGGVEEIRDKLLAYSHTEVATQRNLDRARMASALAEGRSVLGGKPLRRVPLDELPVALQSDPERWRRHLL
jgi:beta-1,4-mannosyl-glycoprotein beta-1,4-N-acetylglucosaminyltransferase